VGGGGRPSCTAPNLKADCSPTLDNNHRPPTPQTPKMGWGGTFTRAAPDIGSSCITPCGPVVKSPDLELGSVSGAHSTATSGRAGCPPHAPVFFRRVPRDPSFPSARVDRSA